MDCLKVASMYNVRDSVTTGTLQVVETIHLYCCFLCRIILKSPGLSQCVTLERQNTLQHIHLVLPLCWHVCHLSVGPKHLLNTPELKIIGIYQIYGTI